MAKSKQSRKLRITTLFLTVAMILAFCAFFLAACTTSDSSDDEEDTSPTRTDTQTFSNANFEYFDDNNESYLIATPENWTSSTGSNNSGVSASSSVAKSGIVDTSIDWAEFVNAYNDYEYYDSLDDDDPELDDAEYYTDIDNEYDIPGWDVADAANDSSDDLSDETIQAASQALNPGTHWKAAGEADEENGTHVLMLHNYRSNKMGTAAKYTSTSVTLPAGTAAKFSVWVKTSNLTFNDGNAVDGNRGAYIEIVNTVGGTTQDSLIVRNIDTSDVSDNNGWEQYTFYVKASSYATTTVSVVLGLGMQTESTSTNYYEYVQGYAFFDDLVYEVMTEKTYEDNLATNVPVAAQRTDLDLSFGSDAFKFDAKSLTNNSFSLDLDTVAYSGLDISGMQVTDTTDDANRYGNTYIEYFRDQFSASELAAQTEQIATDKTLSRVVTKSKIDSGNYGTAFKSDFEKFNDLSFGGSSENILVLYSGLGAPYTATLDSNVFRLAKGQYMMISFWVKTYDLQGGTGATITLIDADTETAIGALDTTTLTGTDLVDDTKKNDEAYKDINDGWQQCFFFITNDTEQSAPIEFTLEFSFGPTSISGSSLSSFVPGYAAFTGFRYATMNSDEYALKTTGDYAVEVSLTGGEDTTENSFDDPSYYDPDQIKTDFADPRNYYGVFGNSTYVGGDLLTNEDGSSIDKNAVNQLASAGLLNKKYVDAYLDSGSAVQEALANCPSLIAAITNWENVFAGTDQPLLIANTVQQAYGFISNTASSISADSYSLITVRVKLSANTTANVYLIDTTAPENLEDKQYTDTLKYTSGVSYRYDEDGNVINKDPEADDYSSKTSTVFYKQDNGLWYTAQDFAGDTYYANLANYERDPETGDLLDSDGNIVYYASEEDGTYYRYRDADSGRLSVKVKDFTAAGVDLTGAVLQQPSGKALSQTVVNNSNQTSDWIYVRFFIASGDEAKNYRLEVWSGARASEGDAALVENSADTFVAFDIVGYSDLTEETFTNLVDLRLKALASDLGYGSDATAVDALEEAYLADPASFIGRTDGKEIVYYHYSLYDDDDYASYDADYSDAETDPYADYDASSYSNEVAYLRYNNDGATEGNVYYDTFVNYGASEITVSSSSSSDDETTDDSSPDSNQNIWLLVISIVLAVVLIFTLVALLVRKLLANIKIKSPRANRNGPSYDNKRKRYIRKLRLEEAEHDEGADDILPDDDEISEEDIYKVETEEQTSEENGSSEEENPAEESEEAPADENPENDGDKNE